MESDSARTIGDLVVSMTASAALPALSSRLTDAWLELEPSGSKRPVDAQAKPAAAAIAAKTSARLTHTSRDSSGNQTSATRLAARANIALSRRIRHVSQSHDQTVIGHDSERHTVLPTCGRIAPEQRSVPCNTFPCLRIRLPFRLHSGRGYPATSITESSASSHVGVGAERSTPHSPSTSIACTGCSSTRSRPEIATPSVPPPRLSSRSRLRG